MSELSPEEIVITRHAWQRFKQRWEGPAPECFKSKLMELLAAAEPEDIGYGTVTRIIDNNFQAAAYYTAEGWRFVMSEDGKRLLTCERPYFNGQRKPVNKKFAMRHTKK